MLKYSTIALEAKKFVSLTETKKKRKKIVYNFETINFSTHVYWNLFSRSTPEVMNPFFYSYKFIATFSISF